jgi:hypothetical protein
MTLKYVSIALAALVASTAPAQAAITVYTTLAAFNTATMAQGTDNYTGFSVTSSTPSPITRNTQTGTVYTYTANATPAGTFFGAGTTANPWLSTNTATDSVVFSTFVGGIDAIGGNFFGSDIAGLFAAGDVTLTAVDSLGATSTQTITAATVTSFRGFVSTGTITSLTLASVQPTTGFLWPTTDNLVLAKRAAVVVPQVPESSTWLMMIAGFGLVGGAMRRRTTARIAQAF